jgi:hypothetical protein
MAVVAVLFACPPALAQDIATCNAAYERADLLIHGPDAGKLLEARENVRTCAGTSCQPWMIKDCTQWLSDLDRRIPSVVLVARDASGNDVTRVVVSVDQKVIARWLDGHAIDVNPGERTFVFEAAGARRIERRSLIREGEKDQVVEVTFSDLERTKGASLSDGATKEGLRVNVDSSGTAGGAPRASAGTTVLGLRGGLDVGAAPSPNRGFPWRTLGYAVGGAGAVVVAIGSVFGVMAIVNNSASNADGHCAGGCDSYGASLRHRAIDEGNASTVAFAVGAALLATGGSVVVLAPRRSKPSSLLNWSPVVSSSTAGMAFSGAF